MCVPKREETIWVASYPSCKSAYWIEGKVVLDLIL
jgi:hypothetical protein